MLTSLGGAALLSGVTATGAGSVFENSAERITLQADGRTTSGSGSAAVNVEVSNNRVNWLTLGTITLTLSSTSSSDGFVAYAPWKFIRGNVTSISGTGASVSLNIGA